MFQFTVQARCFVQRGAGQQVPVKLAQTGGQASGREPGGQLCSIASEGPEAALSPGSFSPWWIALQR